MAATPAALTAGRCAVTAAMHSPARQRTRSAVAGSTNDATLFHATNLQACFVDSQDAFSLPLARSLFAKAAAPIGIPTTAIPTGMGYSFKAPAKGIPIFAMKDI